MKQAEEQQGATAEKKKDVFFRQGIYPEVQGLLAWTPASIETVIDSAVVVPDTNSLLVPYGIGEASLEEIGKKYRSLLKADRLIIPGQVVREFASN